jgi:hypothetical protein
MTEQTKEIELSDGRKAVIGGFKGKHILEAQKVTGKETEKMIFALIASCVKIEGQNLVIEEIEEMNGSDVLVLMGEFGSNF